MSLKAKTKARPLSIIIDTRHTANKVHYSNGWRLKSPRQNLPGRFPPAEIPPAIFPPPQNLPAIFPQPILN